MGETASAIAVPRGALFFDDQAIDDGGGTLVGAGFTEGGDDFGEVGLEGGAGGGIAQEAEHFGSEGVGGEGVLDEFFDDFAFGEDVDHAEVFDADDGFADEVGEPVDVVDEGVREAEAGGFEGGSAGGDGTGGGALHEIVNGAGFDPGGGFGDAGGLGHGGHFSGESGVGGGDGEAGFGVLLADDLGGREHDGEEAADFVFAATGEPADEIGVAG